MSLKVRLRSIRLDRDNTRVLNIFGVK
jgi:hypothetical protein